MTAIAPGRLTPRQKAAINHPCREARGSEHARYHRRTGYWQSILTFDLFTPENEAGPARGIWHARATTFPGKPLADWDPGEQAGVKKVLKRLLAGVGHGEMSIRKGDEAPPVSIHFYREALPSEVRIALDVRGGLRGRR